jgi:hypothetical protein
MQLPDGDPLVFDKAGSFWTINMLAFAAAEAAPRSRLDGVAVVDGFVVDGLGVGEEEAAAVERTAGAARG